MNTLRKSAKPDLYLPLAYCLLISVVFRLPYFFKDVINWDESTFILTGQSLLDGHLPYTLLWDLKPPLLPAAFALFILIFGKSIISIRVAGAVCVALTAWFTYLIGKKISSPPAGYVAATLSVLSLSVTDFRFFGTMSEHVAVVPLVGALLLLVLKPITPQRLFWTGFLLSTAAMMRLNLAYVALFVGLVAVFIIDQDELTFWPYIHQTIARGVRYVAGGLLVIFLTLLPYALTNQTPIWWRSVVLAPLSYSYSEHSAYQALLIHLGKISGLITNWQTATIHHNTIATLIYIGASIGFVIIIASTIFNEQHSDQRRWFIILVTFFLSVTLSILNGGQAHSHYLIQLMPFLALFAMFAFLPFYPANRFKMMLPVAIIVMALMLPIAEYRVMFSRLQAGEDLRYGTAYEIADYFEDADIEDRSIYMMTNHIAYWLIGKYPLTGSSTHPSNISKQHLLELSIGPEATTDGALREILEQKPDFIVTQPGVSYLRDYESMRQELDDTLARHYDLVQDIQSVHIYERVRE